ncbi:uncharacterized protein EV422DRAFT_519303 [Fimicolochytrium jonesii]|uniref:uncharacterized protein n=1 Tax=Fimicolochytrium jonesii TaxID=1396493 RepID=UPI0022FEBBE5|nr:uncharacterized protein EV422DRAFT_519303 [Fimicolochytrium jonesii]KAI8824217.1 hypothetical protein EV422DRAFT_519303 [Fimicolochytrium jonesii]
MRTSILLLPLIALVQASPIPFKSTSTSAIDKASNPSRLPSFDSKSDLFHPHANPPRDLVKTVLRRRDDPVVEPTDGEVVIIILDEAEQDSNTPDAVA